MKKNDMITHFGVRSGRHAGNVCFWKLVVAGAVDIWFWYLFFGRPLVGDINGERDRCDSSDPSDEAAVDAGDDDEADAGEAADEAADGDSSLAAVRVRVGLVSVLPYDGNGATDCDDDDGDDEADETKGALDFGSNRWRSVRSVVTGDW